MAELDTSQGGGKHKGKGKKRAKKASTRVDLTPMVDLGFLLVTFFMLTTTFSKPQTMEINMPVKDKTATVEEQGQDIKASKALTIILAADNMVYYYSGMAQNADVQKCDYSANGLRKMLLEKSYFVKDVFVSIKATNDATYRNVIDALDEMLITNISHYALVDITPEDIALTKKL